MKPGGGQIFVSYARADEPAVAAIYTRLKNEGYRVWMDRAELTGGDDWRAEILKAIRTSDYFLAMLSANSVDREGVLRGELSEALALRSERLDRGSFLIPVRLDDSKLPKQLGDIQWVDWFAPDGWQQLRRALDARRRGTQRARQFAAAVLLILILAAGAYFWWQHRRGEPGSDDIGTFNRARSRAESGGAVAGPPQIGLTLWQVRETDEQGAGSSCPGISMVRIPLSTALHWKDAVRIGVESSRPGYLYVFEQELHGDAPQAPELIYPTLRLPNSTRAAEPGAPVEIPPAERCASFRLDRTAPDHTGELITVMLSPKPLPNLKPGWDPVPVDPELFRTIQRGSVTAVREAASNTGLGRAKTAEEEQAGSGTRKLRWNEIAPHVVYTFPASVETLMLVRLRLGVS